MKTREKENETNFLMHSNHVIKASDKSIHVLHNVIYLYISVMEYIV